MITKKMVLILGAGASKPYEFPLGDELINEIENVRGILAGLGFGSNLIDEFYGKLRGSDVTIDRFLSLDNNKDFVEIGKMTIATIICKAEYNYLNRMHTLNGDWYRTLWQAMNSGVQSLDDFGNNQVSVLTYNYERSLEHYLYTRMCNLYGNINEVATQISKINIVHLHGQIGYLEWQQQNNDYYLINPFGGIKAIYDTYSSTEEAEEKKEDYYVKINRISKGIKIIHEHEDITKSDDFNKANQLLDEAEEIHILGCGLYDTTNLERLALKRFKGKGKKINTTNYKTPDPVIKKVDRVFDNAIAFCADHLTINDYLNSSGVFI